MPRLEDRMEKKVWSYPVSEVKALITEGRYSITARALNDAEQEFGLDENGILTVVMGLTISDFSKSMTSHNDHTLWQDVYFKEVCRKRGYIKLQITKIDSAVIISFHTAGK